MDKKMLLIIFTGLFGLLCVSFFAFYKIYASLYGKELLTRIDPIYGNTNNVLKTTRFCFIGDSRIAHWKIPDSILSSSQMINLGIDAQTTSQVLYRAKDYFSKYKAEYVFIQVGINDLKVIGFYPEKEDYIVNTTINNIKALMDLCLENSSNPVFLSIFPSGKVELSRALFWNSKIDKAIVKVNTTITEYCKRNRIQVIDSYKLLANSKGKVEDKYQNGCLHINEKGYNILNTELNNFLMLNHLK
jgi:lysophospholipase L1-like esterase